MAAAEIKKPGSQLGGVAGHLQAMHSKMPSFRDLVATNFDESFIEFFRQLTVSMWSVMAACWRVLTVTTNEFMPPLRKFVEEHKLKFTSTVPRLNRSGTAHQ